MFTFLEYLGRFFFISAAISLLPVSLVDALGWRYGVTPHLIFWWTTMDPWIYSSRRKKQIHEYSVIAALIVLFVIEVFFLGWLFASIHIIVSLVVLIGSANLIVYGLFGKYE